MTVRSHQKEAPSQSSNTSTQLLEGLVRPIMLLDRKLNISFVNESLRKLLRTYSQPLRSLGVERQADMLIGQPVEALGLSPQTLKNLLADTGSLPVRTPLQAPGMDLQLALSLELDSHGNSVGYVVEFRDQTENIDKLNKAAADHAQLEAVHRAQAVIEFDLDGKVREVNPNFLSALGYTRGELIGQHHSLFMPAAEKNSAEYAEFWAKLRRGESVHGVFNRIAKSGKEMWLRASYNPVFDAQGQLVGVVKFATDITEDRNRSVIGCLDAAS